jgi:Fe-S cluster biogenesis protein NfuA
VSGDQVEKPVSDELAGVVKTVLAPLLAIDGGCIELVSVRDGVAEITLSGACAGCPGQSITTREVVLPALRAVDGTISAVKVSVGV